MAGGDTGSAPAPGRFDDGDVRVHRDGPVAILELDRPAALNALSTHLARRLVATARGLAEDASVAAVVVAGAGERALCVGADLKERAGMDTADFAAQREVFRAAFGAVLDLPQPAIAAVHGFALGAGFELALSCDLIVAEDGAVVGLPEASIGLVPGGGGTQLLLRRVGAARAAELVLTGRHVPAPEAAGLGLLDRLVPAGRSRDAAIALAQEIARNSPIATRAAKRALRAGWGVSLATGLEAEDAAWRTAAFSADRAEGIAAFVAKRPPSWPSLGAGGH